jgi:three-Cys-motif partner protein
MNHFGGDWTESKIEILVEYAKAYLIIMNAFAERYNWKLLYFDGFAGSGHIKKGNAEDEKIIVGAATRILEIDIPRHFDMYYFVEKEPNSVKLLENSTKIKFPEKNVHIVNTDCNEKILSMKDFLISRKGRKYKALAYIDPCGMQLNWSSLVALHKMPVDAWILIPTGMGINRLLTINGKISDAWISKLEVFLGMEKTDILKHFYKETEVYTLFGPEVKVTKEQRAAEKSASLYKKRLEELFKYVSEPYILKNRSNSIMFHFLMVSNNEKAVNIANDIVSKYNKLA